jgi:hypothetical protein
MEKVLLQALASMTEQREKCTLLESESEKTAVITLQFESLKRENAVLVASLSKLQEDKTALIADTTSSEADLMKIIAALHEVETK